MSTFPGFVGVVLMTWVSVVLLIVGVGVWSVGAGAAAWTRRLDPLWAVWVQGPDDLVAMISRGDAEVVARRFDTMMAILDIPLKAEVVEWPHSREAHLENLTLTAPPDVRDAVERALPPDVGGRQCAECGEWVRAGWLHGCC